MRLLLFFKHHKNKLTYITHACIVTQITFKYFQLSVNQINDTKYYTARKYFKHVNEPMFFMRF